MNFDIVKNELFVVVVLLIGILLLSNVVVYSAIIRVPEDAETIQEAVYRGYPGDIVSVSPGTYTGPGNVDVEVVSRECTILAQQGPESCIIDCQGSGRAFRVYRGSPVIKGFTIRNGYVSDGDGGAIHTNQATVQIEDCYFYNNVAIEGGALYLNGIADVRNCVFIENDALEDGGGILARTYEISISASQFIRNEAGSGIVNEGNGGGFYFGHGSSIAQVNNCSFTENTAELYGGGLYGGLGAVLKCVNSLFTDNLSTQGGGIHLTEHNLTLGELTNCTFFGNVAFECGGGFCTSSMSFPTIMNSVFWNNSASYGDQVALIDDEGYGSEFTIDFSLLEGGENGVYVCNNCSLIWGSNNMEMDPLFTSGPAGELYLSHVDAGQTMTSPCVDSGSDFAVDICFETGDTTRCLDEFHTRTDQVQDAGMVDIGYHYSSFTPSPTRTPLPTYTPSPDPTVTPTPTNTPTHTPVPTITPSPTPTPYKPVMVSFNAPDHVQTGNVFWVTGSITNDLDPFSEVIVVFALQWFDSFWLWPEWAPLDHENLEETFLRTGLNSGTTSITIVEPMIWPDTGNDLVTNLWFHGAVLSSDDFSLISNLATHKWGFGPL